MALSKTKKTILIIVGIILLFVAVVILCISPITKYMVEKYDEKFTGRQITMDWAYVNPFTGAVYFSGLKIYEYKSDSIFMSFGGFGVNLAILKLLSKEYEISDIRLNHPKAYIIKDKKKFNFSDVIEKFVSSDTIKKIKDKAPAQYNIKDIKITDGEFHYMQTGSVVNYFIKEVDFESPGLFWNRDTVNGRFAFTSGMGSGNVKGDFTFNLKNKDYKTAVVIQKFDLKLIEQYMKDLANYGHLSATLDAGIHAKGNVTDVQDLNLRGSLTVNNFHFGKNKGEDYTSFQKLVVGIRDLSPKNKLFVFDSVIVLHPYFKYEKYDSLDNVQQMFGKKGSNVKAVKDNPEKFNLVLELADYVKKLASNFLHSYYKINKVAIYKAEIEFNDFSPREKFSAGLTQLTIVSDSIDKNHKRFGMSMKSGIKPYGDLSVLLSMNPKTEGDFDLSYNMQKIPLTMFNPYLVSFTSFPMDRGSLEFKGQWAVRNQQVESRNHLIVVDPRTTKRDKKNDTKWIPVPLLMAFVREKGNVIDYEIPITGSLKNPKFKVNDIIFDLLKNVFVKPVSTPYRFQVKNVEQELEKYLTIKWGLRKAVLIESQQEFSEKMATFLKDNQEAAITVQPLTYEEKEKEHIMLFEAKKKYFMATRHKSPQSFNEDDSAYVDKMSTKDPGFTSYLDKQVKDHLLFTVQQKAYRYLGDDIIVKKYNELLKKREEVFVQYFKDNGTANRVKILANKSDVPFNGFSTYKINYHGDIPESLKAAYEELASLNREDPRKQYKKERKKIFGIL